jgi:PAS domain S-box-containing protein
MTAKLDPRTLLDAILEGIGQPFYVLDGDWHVLLYNDHASRHFGWPPGEMVGKRLWDIFPEDRGNERGRILQDAMARREAVSGETMSMMGRYVAYRTFPVGDGLGVAFRDVTDRRTAEILRDKAEASLRHRSAELEAVLETIPTAVWFTYDREVRTLIGNRRAAELLHVPQGANRSLGAADGGELPYRFFRDGRELPPEALPTQRAARGEDVQDEVFEVRFTNGERRLLLVRATPLLGADGEIAGAVCAAADVTERHRYEDHLKLLVNELNHRVKNTLAIVQSIATLTLKGTEPAARIDFEQRLLALAAVHNLLSDANWDGVQIQSLVRASLRAHLGGERGRIAFHGDDFRMKPKSAVALSIALHELATNATKYGALSLADGRVDLAWTITGDRFHLAWRESGGPLVARPARSGFGSRMIERGLAAELEGTAHIDYRPDGVVCTIDSPLDAIREEAPRS